MSFQFHTAPKSLVNLINNDAVVAAIPNSTQVTINEAGYCIVTFVPDSKNSYKPEQICVFAPSEYTYLETINQDDMNAAETPSNDAD